MKFTPQQNKGTWENKVTKYFLQKAKVFNTTHYENNNKFHEHRPAAKNGGRIIQWGVYVLNIQPW